MFVTTKLAKLKKTSLFVASTSGYARAAVAAIGYETVVSPYWSHALQIWLIQVRVYVYRERTCVLICCVCVCAYWLLPSIAACALRYAFNI